MHKPFPNIGLERNAALNLWGSKDFAKFTGINDKSFARCHSDIIESANQILFKEKYVDEIENYIGSQRKRFRALRAYLQGKGSGLSPVFRSILESYGIWADGAYALTLLAGGYMQVMKDKTQDANTELGSYRLFSINYNSNELTWIDLGENHITWRPNEMTFTPIPEAMRVSLIGEPLSKLISHPGLDNYPIMIKSIDDDWDWPGMVSIVTDHHR